MEDELRGGGGTESRKAYVPPVLTFEGTLHDLTMIPTFTLAPYEASPTPLS